MLIVTTNDIPGHTVADALGQVFGLVVRSRGFGGNLAAGFRSLVGGEITEYTQMLEEARRHAIDRLVENAALMGADAVVGMRFDSAEIGETMTEVVAYGTAVRLARAEAREPLASASGAERSPPAGAALGQPAPAFGHRMRTP